MATTSATGGHGAGGAGTGVYAVARAAAVADADQTVVQKTAIPGIDGHPHYSIRNGDPRTIVPYLLRGSIATMYHWVPVNGIRPIEAMRCVDAFIRSHEYQLTTYVEANAPPNQLSIRRMAVILGTARAVMTATYDIGQNDLVPAETAEPVLRAILGPDGAVTYRCLLAANAPNRGLLTEEMELANEEMEVIKVVVRSAQAIVPIQGLNLMTDGHHYLSERTKSSYKAFLAVEKQLWVGDHMRAWVQAQEGKVQDLLWHKAGHPVSVQLKEACATSTVVKENLKAAKVGSAATRLPALESDLKAAQTYLKVADAVGPIWRSLGGYLDASYIRACLSALERLPIGGPGFAEPTNVDIGVEVRTRDDVLRELRRIVEMSSDSVAQAFGFYCSMVERSATEGGMAGADTLRSAFSLRKLMNECRASYTMGSDLYKDYVAVKARARERGIVAVPKITLGVEREAGVEAGPVPAVAR